MKKIPKISLWLFWIILTLLYSLSFTIIEFKGVPVTDFYSFGSLMLQYIIVVFCTSGFLLLISSFRLIFAIFFPLITLISSVVSFFSISIGTQLTPVSIEIALVNGATMWWSMISWKLILIVVVSIAFSVLLSIYRWKYVSSSGKNGIVSFFAGLIIFSFPFFVNRIYAPVSARLPYSIYYSFKGYLTNREVAKEERNNFKNEIAEADVDSPDIILILGESLRADHIPMNGYYRNTMPHLSTNPNLISFSSIYSDETFTDRSLPVILTGADGNDPEKAYTSQSFITLFKNAGFKSAWFANQDLSRSYNYFAHEADTLIYGNADRSFYSYDLWLDKDLVPLFRDWLNKNENSKKIAIIHTIGSHWWYKSHYLPEHALFKPEVEHKEVGGLSKEKMINSYDNTIIATDDFINDLFEIVKDRNAIIFFISDHGEGLGEDGVFLHASETEPLHFPAAFVIYTDKYAQLNPSIIENLKNNRNSNYKTDMVFHTLLDLASIKTKVLNQKRSAASE